MGKLTEKVAIITGGARGIGEAAAKLFIEEGAKVMLVDVDEKALIEAVLQIGEERAAYTVADVRDPDQNQAFVAATLERFGSVDIALLNAGIEGMITPITDYTPEIFNKVININVGGVFLGLQAIMPVMSDGGGSIVVTSSTAGIRAIGGMSAYVASKHAVIGLMRTAALEGAANNIRVNAVNPSPIDTRMISSIERQAGLNTDDRKTQPMAKHTPLLRYGEPEEVARMMLFLSSDDSSFCTGGVYMVDGGVSAGRPSTA
jgi:NAD(P)-dependent dehydrogenase (short-subunit alcohol dehydrogenase family)